MMDFPKGLAIYAKEGIEKEIFDIFSRSKNVIGMGIVETPFECSL